MGFAPGFFQALRFRSVDIRATRKWCTSLERALVLEEKRVSGAAMQAANPVSGSMTQRWVG